MTATTSLKAVGGLDTLGLVLGYHDYRAEHISADYGSEWNASIAAKLKKLDFMLKYADYHAGRRSLRRATPRKSGCRSNTSGNGS